jgi:hypothetical protein
MERRRALFRALRVDNLQAYNQKSSAGERLPFVVVVIDEVAELQELWQRAGEREGPRNLLRLSSMARSAGIALVVATQKPTGHPPDLRLNAAVKVGFRMRNAQESLNAIDVPGAERLPSPTQRPGRLLAVVEGELHQLQGFYVDREATDAIVATVLDDAGLPSLADPYRAIVVHACTHWGGDLGLTRVLSYFSQANADRGVVSSRHVVQKTLFERLRFLSAACSAAPPPK